MQLTFEIPFELEHIRNSRFTGRESLLESLHTEVEANRTSDSSKPIVLYGTGGIGKTQIVTEYIYSHRKEFSAVFWIKAASPETIYPSFRTALQRLIKEHAKVTLSLNPDYELIAQKLGVAGVVDKHGSVSIDEKHNDRIVDGMKLWFSQEKNRDWLLIFDNVDDLETFGIRTFFPPVAHGTILMTSRRPECGDLGKGLEVIEMLEQEGVELLLRSSRQEIRGDILQGKFCLKTCHYTISQFMQ